MSRHHDYDYDDDERVVIIEKESGALGNFFVGLAIGAGLALMFAPQSGEETRRGIKRRARRARQAARQAVDDVTGTVAESFSEARRRVEEQLDSARSALEMRKEQVSRAMDAGRAAAQQARDELEKRIVETKAAYDAGVEVARRPMARHGAPKPAEDREEDDDGAGA